LASSFPQLIGFPDVALPSTEYLWVVMAGYGYTDLSAPAAPTDWTRGAISRQLVKFASYVSVQPVSALIPWVNTVDKASQCLGDSGGPVFVAGRSGRPLVIGVLSAVDEGVPPNTVSNCAKTKHGEFVNLGHPYIAKPLCDRLGSLGLQCFKPPSLVKNASVSNP
jgi:hypothetical protein